MRALLALLLVIGYAGETVASPDWDVRRDPFDRAVIARYRQILARDPHDPILAQLVALYRRYRTVDELRKTYQAEDWASLVVRARIERGHDDAAARELFARATGLRDDDVRSWIALGELQRLASPSAARTAYRTALGLLDTAAPQGPTRARLLAVRTALAEIAVNANDIADADLQLRALIALDPTPARYLAHGDAMLATRPADALASFREAEKRTRDPLSRVDAMTRQGNAHAKLGDHALAIAELRRALAIAPRGSGLAADLVQRIVELARTGKRVQEELAIFEGEWPETRRGAFEHLTLGWLQEAAGFTHRAIREYEAAIAAAPKEPVAYRHLVSLYDRLGKPLEAMVRFENMASMFPKDSGIQLELARRYGLAREAEAVAVLESLSRAVPKDAGVQAAIADVYVAWRRPKLAAAAYERAAKLDPSYRTSLALAYAAAGDRDALVALARAAVKDAARLEEIATMMLEHAMWIDAHATFSDGIAVEPKRATLWSGRAGANEGLERWGMAADDAARALALTTKPDDNIRRAMRHIVVRNVLRSGDAERYWKAWRTQLVTEPAHVDLPKLLAELETSEQITTEMRLQHLQHLHKQFPKDDLVMQDLLNAYVLVGSYTEALQTLNLLAALPGQDTEVLAERRKEIQKQARDFARDRAWQIAAFREGVLVDVAPRNDAASQTLRVGLRAAFGMSEELRMLRLGAIATLQLDGGLSLAGRVDWTEAATPGGHTRGAGGSAGLVGRLAETPNALYSVGGAVRVDVRSGPEAPVAVAGEAGLDVTSRYTPFGLGFRLGRYLGGGTIANVELVVEWR